MYSDENRPFTSSNFLPQASSSVLGNLRKHDESNGARKDGRVDDEDNNDDGDETTSFAPVAGETAGDGMIPVWLCDKRWTRRQAAGR